MRKKRLLIGFWSILVIGFLGIGSYGFTKTPKEIYQGVSPGVVLLFASESSGSGSGSAGTGSIITEDGLIITNAHIFTRKDSSLMPNIYVFLKPDRVTGDTQEDLKRRYKGKVLAYDVPLDLALVKIEKVDVPLPQVGFGDSDKIVVGDQAYAIGHPEQGGLWSLTTGVISAQQSNYAGVRGKNLFQTEASINRGNSGGPLLDEGGAMIGINSMIARKAEDGLAITAVNFAIKSNVAIKWLNGQGYRVAALEAAPPEPRQEPVKEEPPAPKEPVRPVIKEEPKTEPVKPEKEVISPEPEPEKERKEGEILTEKKPFKMDELIAGIQEMEDMMDEMRETIEEFRKRRR
ncbi:MAG TPA: trypsin-like peptidase domain-containing protein [Desulfatiglandales bacterium]|nr:trypsin-like peptidase domain-containing protein [Desulfatiglandales bacterium]